jgi:hypothetical protein
MEDSKIHLSSAERELMGNAEIILTKNRVLQKAKILLQEVEKSQLQCKVLPWKEQPFLTSPKISRGENYEGLPWMILDFPRMSSSEDLFFIRSLFWWGRFFSCTLQLAGKSKMIFAEKIAAAYPLLKSMYIGIHENPWIHHFEGDNYQLIGNWSQHEFTRHCRESVHLKIADKWQLDCWEEAPSLFYERWKFFLGVVGLITQPVK